MVVAHQDTVFTGSSNVLALTCVKNMEEKGTIPGMPLCHNCMHSALASGLRRSVDQTVRIWTGFVVLLSCMPSWRRAFALVRVSRCTLDRRW